MHLAHALPKAHTAPSIDGGEASTECNLLFTAVSPFLVERGGRCTFLHDLQLIPQAVQVSLEAGVSTGTVLPDCWSQMGRRLDSVLLLSPEPAA